jgi:histidine kinase
MRLVDTMSPLKPSRFSQVLVIAILVVAYVLLGCYFHAVLHTDIVYTHLAYVPIVLASMWWGRKGLYIASLMSALILLPRILGMESGPLWSDLSRIAFFFVVAACIGVLSSAVHASQRALAESEKKYRALIDHSLAGIVVYADQRILFANSRFSEMTGYSQDELTGKSIWKLISPEDIGDVKKRIDRQKAADVRAIHYECRLMRADSDPIWVDALCAPVKLDGQSALLVNMYNITDRKKAEEKQRKLVELTRIQEEQLVHSTRLAEMGEMASSIAHELNQPLTGIRNFAKNSMYMIEHSVGGLDEVTENQRLISEQVDRASRIINQMRELARKSDRKPTPIDLNHLIREAVAFLQPQFKQSQVEVVLELSDDLLPVVGDRLRLEQVFLNLLTNARQAMEESSVRQLRIRTYMAAAKDSFMAVTRMSDTGKGISDDEMGKLFKPFYTTKGTGQGTGLGLSISLNIAREHGGDITATGTPGKGATFLLKLPVPKKLPGVEKDGRYQGTRETGHSAG